jgi:hypothetical protein
MTNDSGDNDADCADMMTVMMMMMMMMMIKAECAHYLLFQAEFWPPDIDCGDRSSKQLARSLRLL